MIEAMRRGRSRLVAGLLGALLCALPGAGARSALAQAGPGGAPDPVGHWVLALEGAFASQSWALDVGREDGALKATLVLGTMGSAELQDVTLTGDTLSGHFTANMHGQEMHVTVTSAIAGEGCKGAVIGFPMGDIPFTGRREKS